MPSVYVSSTYADGERRVESEWTIRELAKRMEPVTGIPPESQDFEFVTESGGAIPEYTPDTTLGQLGITAGWTIRVSDSRPEEDQLHLDDGGAAKPGMSYEEYSHRQGTLLQWKRENHLGRFSETREAPRPEPPSPGPAFTLPIGAECFVRLISGKTVRGVVAYHGEVAGVPAGDWVGVRLSTPDGMNDGSVKGVRLFDAEPLHGVLVRPAAVRPLSSDEEEL